MKMNCFCPGKKIPNMLLVRSIHLMETPADFNPEDYIDLPLRPRLLPNHFHLGSEPAHIEYEDISIRIGRRPLITNIRKQYEGDGKEIPGKYKGIYLYHHIFQCTYFVHVMDRGWIDKVIDFGLEIEYPNDVTIIDLFPKTAFERQRGEAFLGLDGKYRTAAPHEWATRAAIDLVTPEVVAVGEGDFNGEWKFRKAGQALAGSYRMMHSLLVLDGIEELMVKAQVYATFQSAELLPDKRKSAWVELECTLPGF